MVWVKICANTNLEDALFAAECGADAVGFVFAPSPRRVDASQVAAITRHLPDTVQTVGVFPAWDANRIADAVQESGISTVQLHGGPNLELAQQLDERFAGKIEIIPVLHWIVGSDHAQAAHLLEQAATLYAIPPIHHVLIDSKVDSRIGGTGVPVDWSAAKPFFSVCPASILAGGLNPVNVGEAIRRLRPWGVDVASGVESYPGKKDRDKLAAFLAATRGVRSNAD